MITSILPGAASRRPVRSVLRSLFVLTFVGLFATLLPALQPPTAEQWAQYQADGSLAARIAKAKALGNNRINPMLVAGLQEKLRAAAGLPAPTRPLPPPAWRNMPTTGTVNVLVLMIAFADHPPVNSAEDVAAKIFGSGVPGDSNARYPYESLNSYYERASYGKLHIRGKALGWYTTPYARSHVAPDTYNDDVNDAARRETLIQEALNHYEARGEDFSPYDNDGDGVIDYLIVFWSGPHAGWMDFWWAYTTYFDYPDRSHYRLDGKRLGAYSWQWESENGRAKLNPDTLIHETGHALGLPDYYDYDDAVGPKGGVGGYDMMDGTYGDHNCFSKFLLDWITPTFVNNGGGTFTLRASGTSPDALVVMPGVREGNPFDEFFMVQCRYPDLGNDTYAGRGLVIWHVDARLNTAGEDFVNDNSVTPDKLLKLMEADGNDNIESGDHYVKPADFYVSGKSLTPLSRPNNQNNRGALTTVSIDSIGNAGPVMSCRASARKQFELSIQVTPSTAASWLMTRRAVRIDGVIARNGAAAGGERFVVFRAEGTGEYQRVGEVPASAVRNNTFQYVDKYVSPQKTYKYIVLAYDGSDQLIAASPEKTM